MKTCLFKYMYIENFTSKKTENFQIKLSDVFHISAKNIDCGYSLELPRLYFWAEIRKIMNTPCKPQVLLYKSGV